MYCLNKEFSKLEKYNYKNENELQNNLFEHPELVLELEDLDLTTEDTFLVCREFPISCGYIDLLVITKNADIIFVETKLLRNPESSRTVIAQIIDYIKTAVYFEIESFINTAKKLKDFIIDESLINDDRFICDLKKNFEKGNISGVILGDEVNSNVLELIDSIQSAPHLSFTLFLVALNTFKMNDSLLFYPEVISKTKEIERSVINITITDGKVVIDSETPRKTGKGTKPVRTWEEYIKAVEDVEKASIIKEFYKKWQEFEPNDGVRMGTSGFSSGISINGKRNYIQLTYDSYLELLTEKYFKKVMFNSKNYYDLYKSLMSKCPSVYDRFIVSGKTFVLFSEISSEELKAIFDAAYNLAKKIKEDIS